MLSDMSKGLASTMSCINTKCRQKIECINHEWKITVKIQLLSSYRAQFMYSIFCLHFHCQAQMWSTWVYAVTAWQTVWTQCSTPSNRNAPFPCTSVFCSNSVQRVYLFLQTEPNLVQSMTHVHGSLPIMNGQLLWVSPMNVRLYS